jgi:hypothetical protein
MDMFKQYSEAVDVWIKSRKPSDWSEAERLFKLWWAYQGRWQV